MLTWQKKIHRNRDEDKLFLHKEKQNVSHLKPRGELRCS